MHTCFTSYMKPQNMHTNKNTPKVNLIDNCCGAWKNLYKKLTVPTVCACVCVCVWVCLLEGIKFCIVMKKA